MSCSISIEFVQEHIHVENPVDIEDLNVDLDILIDARVLIEQKGEVSIAVDQEGNVCVLVHHEVLVDVNARDHLAHVTANHDTRFLVDDRDLPYIDAVGIIDLANHVVGADRSAASATMGLVALLQRLIWTRSVSAPVMAAGSSAPVAGGGMLQYRDVLNDQGGNDVARIRNIGGID